jgi:aspartate-semialdehyde dehydrogenase
MTYSVLLLGASGTIGTKIAAELAIHKDQLKRVAFLTPLADAGPEKEEKYKVLQIERVVGSLENPTSYQGFDIVVSAVGDALCASQPKYMDAAFAGGVKHLYPAECTFFTSLLSG